MLCKTVELNRSEKSETNCEANKFRIQLEKLEMAFTALECKFLLRRPSLVNLQRETFIKYERKTLSIVKKKKVSKILKNKKNRTLMNLKIDKQN